MIFGLPITFSPDLADKIVDVGRRGLSPDDAEHSDLALWFHLLTVVTALCPKKEFTVKMVETMYDNYEAGGLLECGCADCLEGWDQADDIRDASDPTH